MIGEMETLRMILAFVFPLSSASSRFPHMLKIFSSNGRLTLIMVFCSGLRFFETEDFKFLMVKHLPLRQFWALCCVLKAFPHFNIIFKINSCFSLILVKSWLRLEFILVWSVL